MEGVKCGDYLCLQSMVARDHYLVARPDSRSAFYTDAQTDGPTAFIIIDLLSISTRLVWHPFLSSTSSSLSECAQFSVYCDNPYPPSSRLDRSVNRLQHDSRHSTAVSADVSWCWVCLIDPRLSLMSSSGYTTGFSS